MQHDAANTSRYNGACQALYDLGLATEKTAGIPGAIWGWAGRIAGKPLAWLGDALLSSLAKTQSPKVIAAVPGLREFGTGLATEAGKLGLISGGLEAALAPPGERTKAFGRGFGYGALGGLGWGAGSRLASRGYGRALGVGHTGVEALGKQRALFTGLNPFGKAPVGLVRDMPAGERAKILGAKALPFLGSVAGNDLLMKAVGQPGMIDMFRGNVGQPSAVTTTPPAYDPLVKGLPLNPQQYAQQPLLQLYMPGYNQGYG